MEEVQDKTIEEMFETETPSGVMNTMAELAEEIAIADEQVKIESAALVKKKDKVAALKEQLNGLMMTNDCADGHKFGNLLYPKPYVKTDVFKAKGVDDETLFEWLRSHDLGDIIKPAVHYATLSSTMKAELESGAALPDIFNVANKPTVKFVGDSKSKYFAAKAMDQN